MHVFQCVRGFAGGGGGGGGEGGGGIPGFPPSVSNPARIMYNIGTASKQESRAWTGNSWTVHSRSLKCQTFIN